MLDEIKKIASIADIGLLYSQNEYDKERYTELKEASFKLLQALSHHSIEEWKLAFPVVPDYPTAKVDIRGLLLSPEKKILLVRESADGKWALPGGWADIGHSPKEIITKEFKEETGLDVHVKALLAVFDKRLHPHPPQPFYVYKMVFLCQAESYEIKKGFDILDAAYFSVDSLPPLSENRILNSQIKLLNQKVQLNDYQAYFD